MNKRKQKIGLVQINNSFSGQNFFPYSVGLLQAYAQKHLENIDDFEFLSPIYKRASIEDCSKHLSDADMLFFSTYVWNLGASSEIARRIKEEKPEILTVFGGCSVPPQERIEEFLRERPFVDMVCHGEGERVFNKILENSKERAWEKVPSISFRDNRKRIVKNPKIERMVELDEIPSPYLGGVFDSLIQANPDESWIGLWETNRGCPFACSYCEWGGDYRKGLYTFDLERLSKEVDWFSKRGVEFVLCCDSNFGVMPRDLEIAKYVAANKEREGYPHVLSVQNTKNSSDRTFEIQKTLEEAGLSKGVNLAFQSLNPKTLKSIGRKNIPVDTFHELQQRFTREGITTFTDIILGLPEETYESFVDGIITLIEKGQYNRIQFNNLSALPNAEMSNPEYQKKYGIMTKEIPLINVHGSLKGDEISELQKLVVGTKTMPAKDWVEARAFGWKTAFLYFDKILQVPLTIANSAYSVNYSDLFDGFSRVDSEQTPILYEIDSFFKNKARDIQNGGAEFCESKKWLNMWWPADELMFINLCTQGKLDQFYQEAKKTIESTLKKKDIKFDPVVIDEAISLNRNLIKSPFQKTDLISETRYNIWEAYRGALTGKHVDLEKGEQRYLINRTKEAWDSWENWCQKVVWYGNKKGAYIYSCTPLDINSSTEVKK